jgi:glutathione peroxidase-family protein
MSFWELSARDIDENLIEFSQFKGKRALLIVNVASEAKLTDSNYKQLNEMKEQFKDK